MLSLNSVLMRLLSFGPVRRLLVRSARSAKTKTLKKGGTAVVMADIASHMSNALLQTFQPIPMLVLPASLPIPEIVQKLNSVRPKRLGIYPSTLYLLTLEAKAGRLRIRPKYIGTAGEPLTARVREAVRDVWNLDITNFWGASEGGQFAWACAPQRGPSYYRAGRREWKTRRTGCAGEQDLPYQPFQPHTALIRYEVDDKVTFLSEQGCPCGSAFRQVEDVQGRQDDSFVYLGDVVVDPLVFESTFQPRRRGEPQYL